MKAVEAGMLEEDSSKPWSDLKRWKTCLSGTLCVSLGQVLKVAVFSSMRPRRTGWRWS